MTTVNDILRYIESLAPASMAENWDNVGLLCGDRQQPVTKVLVALDPFLDVCEEAHEAGAQLILTHHPLIFQPAKAVTEDTAVGQCIRRLVRWDISAINAHTNLDCTPGGVNDVLAARLGLSQVQVIAPSGITEDGRPWGLLRMGTVPEQSLEVFLRSIKENLGCPGLRYADGSKPVHRVAVGGGACGSELWEAYHAGCDTFVTSDIKYNQFWDARDLGMTLIDAGHFWTENPVCTMLRDAVQAKFPEIQVEISRNHRDCMKFF